MYKRQTQISQLEGKKDKLLELSIANAITIQEFKKRNNRFNEQIADITGAKVMDITLTTMTLELCDT